MTKILIMGLTGEGGIGQYETQLGNVSIMIPMVKSLKAYIPDVEISTTIELTDKFCRTHGIKSIPTVRFLPRFDSIRRMLISFFNLVRVSLWQFLRNFFHININVLIRGKGLERYINSDVVLDFNGDIFPNDINNPARLFKEIADILTARLLKVPVVEFVSSPGPFNTWFTRFISKIIFNRINVIINRESISTEHLKELGISKTPIINTACPAFLLRPESPERAKQILLREGIDVKKKPLIGITLCGYNLSSQHTWGNIRDFSDLRIFIPMLKYLLNELNANIFLLPHVYRANPYISLYEHINGPDYEISVNLFKMVNGNKYKGRLKIIEGKYSASEAKAVIGQCDLYISGRVHAGAAALFQAIPTVLLAYGHKHRGFAKLFHQQKYVFEGTDPEALKLLVEDTWKNREEITKVLKERLERVRELVTLNFEIVKEIVDLKKEERNHIPKEKTDAWASRGE